MKKVRRLALSGKYKLTQESRGWNIAQMFNLVQTIAPILLESNWTILRTVSENAFPTSDNPLFTLRRVEPRKITLGHGFEVSGVEVYFPLGPASCLRIAKHQREGIAIISGSEVREISKSLMPAAHRYLYAREKSEKLASLFTKHGCKLIYGVNAFAPHPPNARQD
jgi:hypothetical protein